MPKDKGFQPSGLKSRIVEFIRSRKKKKKKKKNGTAKQVGREFATGVDAIARIRNRAKLPK
jgi:hypothetical protein